MNSENWKKCTYILYTITAIKLSGLLTARAFRLCFEEPKETSIRTDPGGINLEKCPIP